MKAFYDLQPSALEYDNDGTFLFRWNIESYQDEEENTKWKCEEIRAHGTPDPDTIKRAMIKEHLDQDKELSIINKYYSHILQITDDEEAVTRYTEYLNFLKNVDAIISSNF